MSGSKQKSEGHKTVVVPEEMNNKAKALLQVRDAAGEFLNKIYAMSEEHGICSEDAMDAAQGILEGVNIPEEETEEIHKRAKKEGKTFVQVVLELVELGLSASPRYVKKFKRYAKDTGTPLNEVFDECLGDYAYVVIQTHYDFAGRKEAQG